MARKDPYKILKNIRVTEKSMMLQQLVNNESNPSVKRCEKPKYVFDVDVRANKYEIAAAVEEIYKDNNVKVVSVNTINMKPKKRRVRGRVGFGSRNKKAIVTLNEGDTIENT